MVDRLVRVRFECDVSDPRQGFAYKAGQEADIHPDQAVEWLKAGFLEVLNVTPITSKKK